MNDIKPSAPCTPVELPDVRNEFISSWATKQSWWTAEQEAIVTTGLPMNFETTRQSIEAQIGMLNHCDLYWVNDDMCDVTYQLVKTVPLDARADEITWPARHGLVVFAHPFQGQDSKGPRPLLIDAISWSRADVRYKDGTRDAMHVSFYRCVDWAQGIDFESVEGQLILSMGLQETAHKQTALVGGRVATILTGKNWMPLGRTTWPMDARIDEIHDNPNFPQGGVKATVVVGFEPDAEHPDAQPPEGWEPGSIHLDEAAQLRYESMIEDRRLIAALFSLLDSERIVEIEEQRIPRAVQRRDQRARPGRPPSNVKVVYLRRQRHVPSGEGTGRSYELDHRTVVAAYYRQQPYGPQNSLRRRQLIAGFVRGPEGTPIVVKETVRALVR